MVRLITFATEDYSISAERLKATALRHGVDEVVIYDPSYLDFYYKKYILEPLLPHSRGFGWWVWKPYCIYGTLMAMKEDDILIYCDAGNEIVDNVNHIISKMDEDIFLFSNGWQHSHWCKMEVAETINTEYCPEAQWPDAEYYKFKQVQASSMFFRVSQKTKDFIQEWYAWSIMPGMIDNTPRGPQFQEFREHRHDQAILTCLQIKYGIPLHWFPSTTNHHQLMAGDNYPQIFNHHRKKNNEW